RDKKESVIFKGDDNSYYEKIGNDVTCIDDEISFDIPDTWSWTRISTITDITMGSSPKSQDICNDNQYIEFHQGKIYFSKKTLMKSNQYTRKTTKLAPKQSVLLCVRAPVGELNITDRDICIGRGLASIKSLGNINEEFIFYWLHPYKTYLVNQSTGSTFSAITSDTVRKILIPLPPLMEQKEILDKIQKVFTLFENLETVN
ncbi:MAG: restriction endonuclease subunit S, partial [Faecalibacillus intestinalis]